MPLTQKPSKPLTTRQKQVLRAIKKHGESPRELARVLDISPSGAYAHIRKLRSIGALNGAPVGNSGGSLLDKIDNTFRTASLAAGLRIAVIDEEVAVLQDERTVLLRVQDSLADMPTATTSIRS